MTREGDKNQNKIMFKIVSVSIKYYCHVCPSKLSIDGEPYLITNDILFLLLMMCRVCGT